MPAKRTRHYRNVVVVRPYGHWYPGFAHYRRDRDAYRWLALTAIKEGHDVWHIGVGDFIYAADGSLHALGCRAPGKSFKSLRAFHAALIGGESVRERVRLTDLDVLLLRNDPAEDAGEPHAIDALVLAVPNKAGAVYNLLAPLATHGVSMTRFESRPARIGPPDTNTVGMLTRAAAINIPGTILSQFGM